MVDEHCGDAMLWIQRTVLRQIWKGVGENVAKNAVCRMLWGKKTQKNIGDGRIRHIFASEKTKPSSPGKTNEIPGSPGKTNEIPSSPGKTNEIRNRKV